MFVNVRPGHRLWRNEVFGPVLAAMTFRSEEEAVKLANDSDFGLAGAVCSADLNRCRRVVRALDAGITWINCSQPCFCQLPWGGVKLSGFGRDLGTYGLSSYLSPKQIVTYVRYDGVSGSPCHRMGYVLCPVPSAHASGDAHDWSRAGDGQAMASCICSRPTQQGEVGLVPSSAGEGGQGDHGGGVQVVKSMFRACVCHHMLVTP